jgi:hypothetical protein
MIDLIIAFLFSLGFINGGGKEQVSINTIDQGTFGIVITDGVQQKQKLTLIYDDVTGEFKVQ